MSVRGSDKQTKFKAPLRWNEILSFITSHQLKDTSNSIPLIEEFDLVDSKQVPEIYSEEKDIHGWKVGDSVELVVKHQKVE